MTFSIVARAGDAYGVAVASKFIAVGSVVPDARTGVGAVATQAMARVSFRQRALALLAQGCSADETARQLVGADEAPEHRQLGVVSDRDEASYTGAQCLDWAGGLTGRDDTGGYAIQGNILAGEKVVLDMRRAYLAAAGAPLPQRLMAALVAGDQAGGDRRGRQSAAVYAVQPGAGYDGCGVLADIRVDEHPDATNELARVLDLWDLYFGRPTEVLRLRGNLEAEVRQRLSALGRTQADLQAALSDWAGEANLEMRLVADGIDARVLDQLRQAT
ncbi:MAG TPA: DUF1028 domain-containing protein [Dermatophilaceae bacterium]|nr:DUF1028 domain-containing protein [Dermatophilaceae bacterium]